MKYSSYDSWKLSNDIDDRPEQEQPIEDNCFNHAEVESEKEFYANT